MAYKPNTAERTGSDSSVWRSQTHTGVLYNACVVSGVERISREQGLPVVRSGREQVHLAGPGRDDRQSYTTFRPLTLSSVNPYAGGHRALGSMRTGAPHRTQQGRLLQMREAVMHI